MDDDGATDLADVLDLLPIGVWVARAPGGELVRANAAFFEIMGVGARDDVAVGGYAEPYGIFDREGRPYREDRLPFVLALTRGEDVTVDDLVIHRHDGRQVNLRATARPVRDRAGTITQVVIAFADVTAEQAAAELARRAEATRRESERLEALGTLAGGVAHDFNNLLAAIRLIASRLAAGEPEPGRRQDLGQIEAVTESAAQLTTALLRFGHAGGGQTRAIELGELVGRITGLIERTVERGIEVRFEPVAAALWVDGDPGQLEQLVMNLLVNARDAMPGGGRIRVRLEADGAIAVLEVIDSGPGVPAALRERIFEPYFSTKSAAGQGGAGLGLATAMRVAKAMGGRIEVLDADATGARFRVELPALAR